MRFFEFNQSINEGGDSKSTQFNSEVGLLAAMCGVDPTSFDPKNPAPSFANSPYTVGNNTLANIQAQADNYNPTKFNKWVTSVGPKVANLILTELTKLKMPAPTELSWVGGQNQSSVADVKFVNHPVDGISVKEAGAPTLANLTAKSLGLDGEDPDVFRQHAPAEWDAVKQYVFKKVIEIAKAQPGKAFSPIKSKYSITYMEGEIPQGAKRLKVPKVPEQPPAIEPTSEDVTSSGYFVINFGDGIVNEPEERIMTDLPKNSAWQRVFGDYFQGYWNKDTDLKQLGERLFIKIGKDFVAKIKLGLAQAANLQSAVKMGNKSYFYATPKAVFYVPSVTSTQGLALIDLKYTAPKGTNQNFLATIGYPGQTPASVLIYIRYANGIFQTNPTVRVQRLTNPEGLGWIKL
jgi:hypothetical protein